MRIDPLVNPRSVAIVGATDRPGPGRSLMESLGSIGFTGPGRFEAICGIHPEMRLMVDVVPDATADAGE